MAERIFLLDQICTDVDSVIAEQQDHAGLVSIKLPIGATYLGIVASFSQTFKLLEEAEGENFSNLSEAEKRQRAYQIADEGEEISITKKGRNFFERRLDVLYEQFQRGSAGAWGRFIDVHQRCGASSQERGFDVPYPDSFIWVKSKITIDLPCLDWSVYNRYQDSPQDPRIAVANTDLQKQLAQALGILSTGETWPDFLHRETIIPYYDQYCPYYYDYTTAANKMAQLQPGMTLGFKYLYSENLRTGDIEFAFRGMPFTYYPVSTKYPEVTALIKFTIPGERTIPMDKLVQAGKSTPRITLQVPTEAFYG